MFSSILKGCRMRREVKFALYGPEVRISIIEWNARGTALLGY